MKEIEIELRNEDKLEPDLIIKLKNRQRLWRENEHRILFFMASNYHHQASNHTDYFLQEQENKLYELASQTRAYILYPAKSLVEKSSADLKKTFNFYEYSDIKFFKYKGGIVMNELFNELLSIQNSLKRVWKLIFEWRKKIFDILTSDLDGDNEEPTGEEFSNTVEKQSDAAAFQDIFVLLVADLRHLITGAPSNTTSFNIEKNQLTKELLLERRNVTENIHCNLRSLMSKIKAICKNSTLPWQEVELAEIIFSNATNQYAEQIKDLVNIERFLKI